MGTAAVNSSVMMTPQGLWQVWPDGRFVTTTAPSLRHEQLLEYLQQLAFLYPDNIDLEEVGKSFQGRSIQLLKMGVGDQNILFWSQMHGDEASATPALLDIANFLLANGDHPVTRSILETYTLLMIPMLNPDGAEVFQRENAQGIDINRDAVNLATPEGRVLMQTRDRFEPMLGLNLHDQNRKTTVGNTGCLATTAVLPVSGDAQNILTRGRLRSKRACAAIIEAHSPFIPGGIARYDEGWNPLAFGDNITARGTPVVLIESGGLPAGYEATDLTRLSFVALMTVLKGLAEDDLATYDPQTYENLPENHTDAWSDVVVRGGYILQPGHTEAFRADLAFSYLHNSRQVIEAGSKSRNPSQTFIIGDASLHGAGVSVNAHGKVLIPAFEVGVKGLSAKRWMNQKSLVRLAQLGVGTIFWQVDDAEHGAALKYAGALDVRGLPRIVVQANPDCFPQLVLTGSPPRPQSSTLAATLQSLGVSNPQDILALQSLWVGATHPKARPARLRKDQPAFFLMVSAGPDGQVDINTSQLVSVWLDGHEIVLNGSTETIDNQIL